MNKYKLLIIMCFFLFTLGLPSVTAAIKDLNLLGKVIVLDAGHGGVDNGAQNETIIEKELNLILVKKLEQELVQRGAIVYLTREDDRDLSTTKVNRKRNDLYNRAKYINELSPDMYLSIHLNSTPSSEWRGLQVFYTNRNKANKEIATTITNYLKEKHPSTRDMKENNNYYMYKNITTPGVLIEAGFISNPGENYLLRQESYQDNSMRLIAESVEIYFQKSGCKKFFGVK